LSTPPSIVNVKGPPAGQLAEQVAGQVAGPSRVFVSQASTV
jgi:hypothetical protein